MKLKGITWEDDYVPTRIEDYQSELTTMLINIFAKYQHQFFLIKNTVLDRILKQF